MTEVRDPDRSRGTPAGFHPAARYLPPSTAQCPNFVGDSEWSPLVDGAAYFAELSSWLDDLVDGDELMIVGLEVDPELDLSGRRPGDEGYLAFVERLAGLADTGVDVRILVAGRVIASSFPIPTLAQFRDNARNVLGMRDFRLDEGRTAPLAGRVLLDFGGALLGSNHQKVVVIRRGEHVTSFVGGIDLVPERFDARPHTKMTHDGRPWGWHDMAIRLQGPAAGHVHEIMRGRWQEALTLPGKRHLTPRRPRVRRLNPPVAVAAAPRAPAQPDFPAPDLIVRVARSMHPRKIDSLLPRRRQTWDVHPDSGVHEIFDTLATAIDAAARFVYLEDQYLEEFVGGKSAFELYPHLRRAVQRGVKVILVGSGTRDPDDPGLNLRPINRRLNKDLRTKIVGPLSAAQRGDFAVYRVANVTVHSKLTIVDDVFACVGSANMFSRSMAGVDSEVSVAVATAGPLVRDLRVRVWSEHFGLTDDDPRCRRLADLDEALGMWRRAWVGSDVASNADVSHWENSPLREVT